MDYDRCVQDALLCDPPPGTAPEKVHTIYRGLKTRLEEYELSVVQSQSMEGISHTKTSPAEAGRKVCTWLYAYRRALAEAGAAPDPRTSAQPRGHTFDFSTRPVSA